MQKTERYRAIRNLAVGWVLQAIHSTDISERIFRGLVEFISLIIVINIFLKLEMFKSILVTGIVSILLVHTIAWFMTGNFWVYILDSFYWMKNPGIKTILLFITLTRNIFIKMDCCEAILIYGSMCRSQFHIRSDLDLRVLRRRDHWRGLLCLPLALLFRCYSFFIMLPVDMQIVDSMKFLNRQMRRDERPIMVFVRNDFKISSPGKAFDDIEKNATSIMRNGS